MANAIDGNPATGWAIQGPGKWNVNRTATFTLSEPAGVAAGGRWTIRLRQDFGGTHTIGRVRVGLIQTIGDVAARRAKAVEQGFAAWLAESRWQAAQWTVVRPQSAVANISLLTVLDDDSILASGDQSKRQTYDVSFQGDLKGVTALRLEVLPDERLPAGGPGRTDYEGPPGEFFLSEMTAATPAGAVKFAAGSARSFAGAGGADKVIDGDPLTGWSINGGQGKPHTAVFRLAEPLAETSKLDLQLLCERYYAAGLGRFRLSVTRRPRELAAHGWTSDIESCCSNRKRTTRRRIGSN